MNWQLAQSLENNYWKSIANGLTDPAALLIHLGQLADALSFADQGRLPKSANRLLEIGVGPLGIGSTAMQFPALEITGVDPLPRIDFACNDALLNAYLQHLRSRIHYVQAQAEKLPFDDGAFDVVASHNCIDHCESAMEILKEAVRVLRKDGSFLLTVHTFSLVGRLKFETMRRLRPSTPLYIQHPWTFTHGWLLGRLRQLGLEVIVHEGCGRSILGRARLSRFLAIKR